MKSKPTIDDNFDDISRGQVSRLVHSEISEMFGAREATIISKLVANFAAGRATNEMLRDGIAAIAAMHSIINDLENQIQKGIRANENATLTQADSDRYS